MVKPKPLFIPLKTEYYKQFSCGSKRIEYRLAGNRWNRTTCTEGRKVLLSKGYGKTHRLEGVISGFEEKPASELNAAILKWAQAESGELDPIIACIRVSKIRKQTIPNS